MTTPLEDAIAAFRDLAQAQARLRLECEEAEIRSEQLARELGDVSTRCAAERKHVIALASGMMCEKCRTAPATTTRDDSRFFCGPCVTPTTQTT